MQTCLKHAGLTRFSMMSLVDVPRYAGNEGDVRPAKLLLRSPKYQSLPKENGI